MKIKNTLDRKPLQKFDIIIRMSFDDGIPITTRNLFVDFVFKENVKNVCAFFTFSYYKLYKKNEKCI